MKQSILSIPGEEQVPLDLAMPVGARYRVEWP